MTKIVAINGSPRNGWNTDMLIDEAAKGAQSKGAKVIKFNLYKLDNFTGCISCFGCKRDAHKGECVYKDVLNKFLGRTEIFVSGETQQVRDYSKFNWTLFDRE